MKLKLTLTLFILALTGVTGMRAQTPAASAPVAAPAAAAPKQQFTDLQIFEMLGWYIGKNSGINELEPTPEMTDAFIRGMRLAGNGKDAPFSQELINPEMSQVLMTRQMAYMEKLKAKSAEEEQKFFADVKKKPGVVVLDSGVAYEIVKPGTGNFPQATDTVTIQYAGTLPDGTKFDSSYDRGEPAVFALNGVIPGMTEGLQKINKGGKIKIYIPAALGYGERPPQGSSIPPSSALVFEVEMIDFAAPAAQPEPAMSVSPAGK